MNKEIPDARRGIVSPDRGQDSVAIWSCSEGAIVKCGHVCTTPCHDMVGTHDGRGMTL